MDRHPGGLGLKVAREAAVVLFFLALTVAFTWPMAAHLDTTLSDIGDPLLNSFILDWDLHSFLRHGFEAPILYPGKHALAYSENMLGVALLVAPFASLAPLAIHNIAMLLGFALSGYGAFVLARMLTRATIPSLVAGVLYAFVPFKWDHLSHVQIISSEWLPLLLAALIFYRRSPSSFRAALFGAAFLMNGLTNVYWLLFGGTAIAITLIFFASFDGWRVYKRALAAFAIACALLLPILIPYQLVAHEYGMTRRSGESLAASANALDWLVASGRSAVWSRVAPESWRHAERAVFPGLLMILLPLVAISRAGRAPRLSRNLAVIAFRGYDVPMMLLAIGAIFYYRAKWRAAIERSRFTIEEWGVALWIFIGILGSFGERAFFHSFLFRVVEPFRASRVPARWAMIAYVGLAIWAAIGAARFKRFAIVLLALAIVDVAPVIEWQSYTPQHVELYRWIAATKPRAIVEVPMVGRFGLEGEYVYAETIHRVPNFCGTSGFEPPVHRMLWPIEYRAGFAAELAKYGCELVIVHRGEPDARAFNAQQPCLQFVRRFGDDEVYSVTCGNRQRASRMSSSTSATFARSGTSQFASHIGFTYGSTASAETR
jgi:hypothetical protein